MVWQNVMSQTTDGGTDKQPWFLKVLCFEESSCTCESRFCAGF